MNFCVKLQLIRAELDLTLPLVMMQSVVKET
jgi:hypothetical protein